MKIRVFNSFVIIDILTVLLILAIVFIPSNVIRIILGLPFLLFFPGYVLIGALFPPKSDGYTPGAGKPQERLGTPPESDEKKGMDTIERVALSFGMSIAIVALIGLGLNYTPWGIRLMQILFSISAFIIILSVIALIRQFRSLDHMHLTQELHIRLPGWEGSTFNKTLTVILAVAILGSIGVLAYTVAAPKIGERFTEFYILGIDGKAEAYPSVFVMKDDQVTSAQYGDSGTTTSGLPGQVTLGIVNHEQQSTSYSVAMTIDGQPAEIYFAGKNLTRLEQIELPQDGKWEQLIGFVPQHTGDNQKVEFLLYKNGETAPEDTLHLWVNVKEQ